MSAIKKNHEQINEINIVGSAYLKKIGVIDERGVEIKDATRNKVAISLLDILKKQVGKKVYPAKMKKIERLELKHASVDGNKNLLIAERANPQMGIPRNIYHMTLEKTEALLDELEKLEKEEVEIHARPVPKEDLPELTEEEIEVFGDLIGIEPKK